MKKHANIPIFIPHLGCPNQCVFCNQRTISGVSHFKPDSIVDIIESALSTISENTDAEIAFFGGSFTGIDRTLMVELLEIAYTYVKSGKVKSVEWHFFVSNKTGKGGPTQPLLDALIDAGIKVVYH